MILPERRIQLIALLSIGTLACPPSRAPTNRVQPLPTGPTSCANASNADTAVYDTTQLSEQPIARSMPELTYPPEAGRRRIQGRVVLTAIVNADGSVDQPSVTIVRPVHPLLDAEAQRFVSGARLWPGCRDGKPVRVRMAVPVVFDARRAVPGVQEAFLIGLAVGLGGILAALLGGK